MGKVNSSAGAQILQRIKAKRDAICAVQMHNYASCCCYGGGKQNLKYTAAAVMSLFILLRPIFSATLQG
eukprot:847341-Ditylum_brightwellii.AAC.1